MREVEHIQKAFSMYQVGDLAPASPNAIEEAERCLGHPLPPVLKEHYLVRDGFLGPTYAQFLYPLTTLIKTTQFLRSADFPGFLQRAVAFGDNGIGSYWIILLDKPDVVVEWDAEWGDSYEPLDGTLADVWLAEKANYESDTDR